MASRPHPTAHRRLFAALLLGTTLCALAVFPQATIAQQGPTEGDYGVLIRSNDFYNMYYTIDPSRNDNPPPNVVTIPVGATVKWVIDDALGVSLSQVRWNHSVTSDDGTFDSGLLSWRAAVDNMATNNGTAVVYTRTFTAPGTFTYHDSQHPEMVGTVIVVGDGGVAFR